MQYIQLNSQAANDITTPDSGKFNFFIDENDGLPKVKDSNGNIITVDGDPSTLTSLTYDNFRNAIMNNGLTKGAFYEINDFETCYDQPDFDINGNSITTGNYKTSGNVEPIIVFATASNQIEEQAFQAAYPNDKIKYDWTFNITEVTEGAAKGRITERIDEYNNRTDYDHRNILFKRYQNYVPDYEFKHPGTINMVDGTVTGTDTVFTNLGVNNVIYINGSSAEYRITSINSDTEMTVTGITYNNTYSSEFFETYSFSYGYKRNNLDDPSTNYSEFKTFSFEDETYINNYIGDFANLRNYNEYPFLLANNVFMNGSVINNTFGHACYNNTIDDDCSNNEIDSEFYANTIDDDFHNNVIGPRFYRNNISANFNNNQTGYDFNNNIITCNSFYRNRIGNEFNDNKISFDNDFQNNFILNAFNDNIINKNQFYKNHIGNGFKSNTVEVEFFGNYIGNGFNNNSITLDEYNNGTFNDNQISEYFGYNTLKTQFELNVINSSFQYNIISGHTNSTVEIVKNTFGSLFTNNTINANLIRNVIGNDFQNNNIGTDSQNYGSFEYNVIGDIAQYNNINGTFQYNNILNGFQSNNTSGIFQYNHIGNWFNNNTVLEEFSYNRIGNGFYNNNVGEYFGYGYNAIRGNVIGNNFRDNTIRDHFYDNVIADNFEDNTTPANFQYNDVKCVIFNTNFTEFNKQIQTVSYPPTSTTNPDGNYGGISGTTSGLGKDAVFQVDIVSGSVTNVVIQSQGSDYEVNDTITIPASTLNTSVDFVITVTGTSNAAMVAEPYNCTISNGPEGTVLSSFMYNGVYTMSQINGVFD